MNLWKETILVLEENGKSWEDVLTICGIDFQITKENFEELACITNYDAGFGGQEVAVDLMIIGKNFWLERHEYDGSEWWEYKEYPEYCHYLPFEKVYNLTGRWGWGSLKDIKEAENESFNL